MIKDLFHLKVKLIEIDKIVHINLKNTENKTVPSCMITVVTHDDQLLFVQVRGESLKRLKELKLTPGDLLEIGIYFHGSNKNNRKFNNICCGKINFIK